MYFALHKAYTTLHKQKGYKSVDPLAHTWNYQHHPPQKKKRHHPTTYTPHEITL